MHETAGVIHARRYRSDGAGPGRRCRLRCLCLTRVSATRREGTSAFDHDGSDDGLELGQLLGRAARLMPGNDGEAIAGDIDDVDDIGRTDVSAAQAAGLIRACGWPELDKSPVAFRDIEVGLRLEGSAPERRGLCLATPGPQHDQHGSVADGDDRPVSGPTRPEIEGLVGCHRSRHRSEVPVDAVPGHEDLLVVRGHDCDKAERSVPNAESRPGSFCFVAARISAAIGSSLLP